MLVAGLQASQRLRYLYPPIAPPHNQLLHQQRAPIWHDCVLSSIGVAHLSPSFHLPQLHLEVVLDTLASVSVHSPSSSCILHSSRPDSRLRYPRSRSTDRCSQPMDIPECSLLSHSLYIEVGRFNRHRNRAKKSTWSYNHSYNILRSNMGMNMSFLPHYILIIIT